MSDTDLDEFNISGLISTVEVNPAEIFVTNQAVSIPLQGDLLAALNLLWSDLKEDSIQSQRKLVAINLSYAECDQKEFKDLGVFGPIFKRLQELRDFYKSKSRKLTLIKCPMEIESLIRAVWKDEEFCFQNISEAINSLGGEPIQISEELQHLQKAVVEVFEAQFGIKVVPKEPVLLVMDDLNPVRAEVIGVMPMNSENVEGNLAISFTSNLIGYLSEKTFGIRLSGGNPELGGIAAEMINMIMGCAKEGLNLKGFGIEQALPRSFSSANGGVVMASLIRPAWQIEFQSPHGSFYLEAALRSVRE